MYHLIAVIYVLSAVLVNVESQTTTTAPTTTTTPAESCVCYYCTKGNPTDCRMKDMGCDVQPVFVGYAEALGFECLFRFPANAIQSCEDHCVTPSPTTAAPTTTTTPDDDTTDDTGDDTTDGTDDLDGDDDENDATEEPSIDAAATTSDSGEDVSSDTSSDSDDSSSYSGSRSDSTSESSDTSNDDVNINSDDDVDFCIGLQETNCESDNIDDGEKQCRFNQRTNVCYGVVRKDGRFGSGNYDDGYIAAKSQSRQETSELNVLIGVLGGIIGALILIIAGGGYYFYKEMNGKHKVVGVESDGQTLSIDNDEQHLVVTAHGNNDEQHLVVTANGWMNVK